MDFIGLFKATPKPLWSRGGESTAFFRDQLPLETWALLGAIVQSVLFLAVGRVAVLPIAALVVYKLTKMYAMKTGLIRNPMMENVILNKYSAQFPDESGQYGNKPARDGLCVFLIGTACNSPLGILEPGFKDVAGKFGEMIKDLQMNAEEHGFLGQSSWFGSHHNSNNATLTVMYFKSQEDVHKYALGPLHRRTWEWWNKAIAGKKNISIYHELYQVPSGNYESIYANMQPILAAATMHPITKKDGEKAWMSPMVDARKGILKSSKGRMSRVVDKESEADDLWSEKAYSYAS